MVLLKNRIYADCIIAGDLVKVDMFLNHQLDIPLIKSVGEEMALRFRDEAVTKVLTAEASGIAIACFTAQALGVNAVYAKKFPVFSDDASVYQAEVYSFTKRHSVFLGVKKEYIKPYDRLLIVDDFLANGQALEALNSIAAQAKCGVAGMCVAVEKGFQPGGARIRERGIRLESLVIIDGVNNGKPVFR